MLILIAAALLSISGAAPLRETAPPLPVSTQEPDYRYCVLSGQPNGRTVYVSRVFSVSGGTYAVGIENSYNAFVSARFDPRSSSGANCLGPYDSAREAEDERNANIAQRRRDGISVVETRWSYSE